MNRIGRDVSKMPQGADMISGGPRCLGIPRYCALDSNTNGISLVLPNKEKRRCSCLGEIEQLVDLVLRAVAPVGEPAA